MRKNRAQSIIEFSIVLAVVAGIFIAMQAYLKRGLQAGVRISTDQLGKQEDGLPYYDPALGGPTTGLEEEDMPEGGTKKTAKKIERVYPGGAREKISQERGENIPTKIKVRDNEGNPIEIEITGELTRFGGYGFDYYYDPRDWSLHNVNVPERVYTP